MTDIARIRELLDENEYPIEEDSPLARYALELRDTIAALHTDLAYYQAKWEHELSTVSKLERERDALRREVEELKPFKDAIDDQMIILHLGTADTYPAKRCLDEIINWQVSISLDPQVSSDAATLRDTHLKRAEAAERELAELKAWKADATDILGKGSDILIARSLLKEFIDRGKAAEQELAALKHDIAKAVETNAQLATELAACREKVAELDKANTGLAQESHTLRTLLGALVDAVDGTDDLDEMDGDEYQTASKNLDEAMSAARPHTEEALIQRQVAIDAAIKAARGEG